MGRKKFNADKQELEMERSLNCERNQVENGKKKKFSGNVKNCNRIRQPCASTTGTGEGKCSMGACTIGNKHSDNWKEKLFRWNMEIRKTFYGRMDD